MSKDATGQLSARDIRKFHNPLDPRYIHQTVSGNAQVIGAIEQNKPKRWAPSNPKLDTKRYMNQNKEFEGGEPKEYGAAP